MKNGKVGKEKIAFFCFMIASICFYISAAIGIFSKNGSNWVVHLCLGSALLCLSTVHLHRGNGEKDEKDK